LGVAILWAAEVALGVGLFITGGIGSKGFNPIALFATTMLSAGLTLVVCWLLVCKKYGKSLVEGFALRPVPRKTLLASLLIGLGCASAAAALLAGFGKGALLGQEHPSLVFIGVWSVLAVTVPPVEEMYYRGFIFPVLRGRTGPFAAVVIVTLWFGTAHFLQFLMDWISLPVILVVGTVFTIQRHLYGSLVPSIVTHWVYNAALIAITLAARIAQG
jgi:membrane protease YdiL (CAAX protease family)